MFNLFEIDIKKALLIAIILALPLISINIERRDAGGLHWYDMPIVWVVNPIEEFFTKFAEGVSHTSQEYLNLLNIKKENRELKDKLAAAEQELARSRETQIENTQLRKELDFQKLAPEVLIPAQVIGVDLWGEYGTLKINKGTNQGVKKDLTVITREGVVGYILNATGSYSTVLVLTDRNAEIDAVIQRTRARGVVEGMGADLCHIKYLQRTDDVQVGDLVATSGLLPPGVSALFPKGIPIGTVTKVSKKAFGITQDVELRPIVDVSRMEEVMVLVTKDIL